MRAIVTGASSGLGRSLALKLAEEGYIVGVIARDFKKLQELSSLAPGKIIPLKLDISDIPQVEPGINSLIDKIGGLDLFVANAGISIRNSDLTLQPDLDVIAVNVRGFVASINVAVQHFKKQGSGHIVGVSSIAAFWGNKRSMSYNASKAFEIIYLKGISANLAPQNIFVTDIRPGYILTEMTKGNTRMFWVATPEKAAKQAYDAIVKKKKVAYITKRWRYASWLMRIIPQWLYRRAT